MPTPIAERPAYSDLEELIFDQNTVSDLYRLLDKQILSKTEAATISRRFSNLVDVVGGYSSETNIDLICSMWQTSFERRKDAIATKLQGELFKDKDKFVHILMNHGRFRFYEQQVRPLFGWPEMRQLRTWADTLADTIQFKKQPMGHMLVNTSSIQHFLAGKEHSVYHKRLLLMIMLRKCLLYAPAGRYDHASRFLSMVAGLEDGQYRLADPEQAVYDKALTLLFQAPHGSPIEGHVDRILTAMGNVSDADAAQILSLGMRVLLAPSPRSVLEIWRLKAARKLQLWPLDLTVFMSALCDMKLYDVATEMYKRYNWLHDDEQINVLLRMSEENKDWKGLQARFEDMYGRGYLPYEVHYALVMNALASIGSVEEVKELYAQLQKRQLSPSAAVFAALINAHLFSGDIESAEQEFEEFLNHTGAEPTRLQLAAYLLLLIVKVQARSQNLPRQMQVLELCVERQKGLGVKLVDEEHLVVVLNLAATMLSPKDVERTRLLAVDLNLCTSRFLETLVRAYTRLEQFELAESTAYEAHQESDVPFTKPTVYKCQLQNYRRWYIRDRTRGTRQFICDRAEALIERFKNGKIRLEGSDGLVAEIVRFHLLRCDIAAAEAVLDEAKRAGVATENVILPFMQHFLKQRTYEGYTRVLDLYRQMATQKMAITTRSYVPLMQALIYLDGQNDNGLVNAHKLLESVLELNGIKLDNTARTRILVAHAHDNAVFLCKAVSLYVTALPEGSGQANTLLFDFIKLMREVLGHSLSLDLRYTIFNLLGRLYLHQGQPDLSARLVDSGLGELRDIIGTYITEYPYGGEAVIPKPLQDEYRSLVDLKLQLLDTQQADLSEYLLLYRLTAPLTVQLKGQQYNRLLGELTNSDPTAHLAECLYICEEHLVMGNWLEAKLARKRQFLYKVVLLHYIRAIGTEATARNFRILNAYYNVLDLRQLQRDMPLKDPLLFLEMELVDVNTLIDRGGDWTVTGILANIPEFFSPERHILSGFKVAPFILNRLMKAVKQFSGTDNTKAFQLMDQYPETMEYLLYHESNGLRHGVFRGMVDEQVPPPAGEDYRGRRVRTIEALEHLRALHGSYEA